MDEESTAYGRFGQPYSVVPAEYRVRMANYDQKEVLRDNVNALMRSKWGRSNLTRLATEARIGPGSATRIKEAKTSVGLDVLVAVAGALECEPWQLLVPGLNPEEMPSLGGDASGWPMPMIAKSRFTELPAQSRAFVQGYLLRCIEDQEVSAAKAA